MLKNPHVWISLVPLFGVVQGFFSNSFACEIDEGVAALFGLKGICKEYSSNYTVW